MTETKQKLPKWFTEEIELNNVELSMYDFIMGATTIYEMQGFNVDVLMLKDLRKGLDWFRKNNSEAYMVLLD